ncbi:MAG: hypothetical protein JST70_02365 [Bacteroidetes bacterium]|nr:hypothetical protein [Bacteroidota bacterium]
MKNSIILLTLLGICLETSAQDLIVKKSGATIKAKVTEISQTEIRYKRFDNLGGPTITIPNDDILVIEYENGTKEHFGNENDEPILQINNHASGIINPIHNQCDFKAGDVVIFKNANGKYRTGLAVGIQGDSAIIKSHLRTFSMPCNQVSKYVDK